MVAPSTPIAMMHGQHAWSGRAKRRRCLDFWTAAWATTTVVLVSTLCTPGLASTSDVAAVRSIRGSVYPTPAATTALPPGEVGDAGIGIRFEAERTRKACVHLCLSLVRPGAWWGVDGPVCYAGTEYATDCAAICAGVEVRRALD